MCLLYGTTEGKRDRKGRRRRRSGIDSLLRCGGDAPEKKKKGRGGGEICASDLPPTMYLNLCPIEFLMSPFSLSGKRRGNFCGIFCADAGKGIHGGMLSARASFERAHNEWGTDAHNSFLPRPFCSTRTLPTRAAQDRVSNSNGCPDADGARERGRGGEK